ncbi:MAG: hypothetical protein FWF63_02550 [Fibromonadales bacterium]|nr:hypothetical protein [Fibromonadales bacterium]
MKTENILTIEESGENRSSRNTLYTIGGIFLASGIGTYMVLRFLYIDLIGIIYE